MGTGTLQTAYINGQTIDASHVNELTAALLNDFVGRNSSGVPTSGKNLGTTGIPWGVIRGSSLVLNGQAVDTSQIVSDANRIVSGRKASAHNGPRFLKPDGSATTVTVEAGGADPNLVLVINSTDVTVSSTLTKTSLSTAPATNNTCLVDDTDFSDQVLTKLVGEKEVTVNNARKDLSLTVNTMGSEISSLVGTWQFFSINNGSATETFLAFVESTTKLKWLKRGVGYDSSYTEEARIVFSNNDTITLLKGSYVFLDDDGSTIDVTTTVPSYSFAAPSSPATGDYWFSISEEVWKRYSGTSWDAIERMPLGVAICDSSNCVRAISYEFHADYDERQAITFELSSVTVVKSEGTGTAVSVAGNVIDFYETTLSWDMAADLDTGITEAASTLYWLYVTDEGEEVISDVDPREPDYRMGHYHPHKPWRAVAFAYNDSSSDLVGVSSLFGERNGIMLETGNGHGSTNTDIRRFSTTVKQDGFDVLYTDSATDGAKFEVLREGLYTISYQDHGGDLAFFGVSLNSTELTTAINSITTADALVYFRNATSTGTHVNACTVTKFLQRGDLIRPHDDGATSQTTHVKFHMSRVGAGR